MATWDITAPAGSGVGEGGSGASGITPPGDFDGATIDSVVVVGSPSLTSDGATDDTIQVYWYINTTGAPGTEIYGGNTYASSFCRAELGNSVSSATITANGGASPAPTTAVAADWDQVRYGVTYVGNMKNDAETASWSAFTIRVTYTPVSNDRTGSGSPQAATATSTGAGVNKDLGSGSPQADTATSSGAGVSIHVGTGTPQADTATSSGAGAWRHVGAGTPQAATATASGAGININVGAGSPQATASTASGSGTVESAGVSGSGAPQADTATTTASGVNINLGSGSPQAGLASASGAGVQILVAAGSPQATTATVFGQGIQVISGGGAVQADTATAQGYQLLSGSVARIISLGVRLGLGF